jgi:hypothetical protein
VSAMSFKVPQSARVEIKFSAPELHRDNLLIWLRLHPAGFGSPFPPRWVNNLYFDTHDYGAFAENTSGASSRAKVRYRWYGDSRAPDAGTLEVKCKRNFFGWKLRFDVANAPYRPGIDARSLRRAVLEQLPASGRKWLNANPFPVLLNSYRRRYFLSADARIRVTLDTDQAVWDQRYKSYPNLQIRTNLPPILVVEFKFDRRDRELASRYMTGIPIRVGRHSKYMSGTSAIADSGMLRFFH